MLDAATQQLEGVGESSAGRVLAQHAQGPGFDLSNP